MRFALVFLAAACVAFAQTEEELRATSITVTLPKNGPVPVEHAVPTRLAQADAIDIDQLITIGKEVWQIIKDGAPVVDYKNDWAGVVPEGTQWTDMENFQDMRYGPFGWTFKNILGVTTVEFKFTFAFSCKGSYNGHGSFLMNVGTVIEKIYAAWGQTVNVNATVDQKPANYGTKLDPIAGVQIEVTIETKNTFKSTVDRCRVVVRGDCQASIVACGATKQ